MDQNQRLAKWENVLKNEDFWVECYSTTGSTMDIARRSIEEHKGARFGLVLTESQLAGRGRQGKAWEPPKRGFFATYCVRTNKRVQELAGFSLVVGYITSQVLEGCGCKVRLKWPNDIYTEDLKKLCGVLVEIVYSGDQTGILTGIGINLQGEPQQLSATSVHTVTGAHVSGLDIAEILSPPFFDAWEEFERNGFSSFRKRWLAKALYIDEQVTVEAGGVLRQGIFRGVDEIGQMLLEEQGNISHLSSAEIVNLRPIVS